MIILTAVLDGNKDHHFYKEPGSSLTVICSFGSSGRTKSFCRGGCREEEVLVQTDGDRAQRGRYSIEYDAGPASGAVLLVTVTHLTQSDSGRYRCRMDKTLLANLFRDFSITVTEGVDPWTSTPTTAQRFISSSNVPLIVGLTLAITAVLFSAALLVSWRRRSLRASSLVQSTAPHGTVAVVCSTDMENRGSSSGSSIEKVTYNNPAVKDLSYQNLSSDTRDQNQIYCTLTVSQE
ncbi:uncharacterized protein LOC124865429 isoform X3 [Girardinichthys multiradiatus]|uniref:uncharacterized protein LOC124865429 isoform X3 n=1 Tax=Girardinichthys multiradiatus TaxID=208333 RepID=UPI001FABDC58|nr:uncharacterized protein LOC124865429 isoform X3 [Girardinichthys multiradiatus]